MTTKNTKQALSVSTNMLERAQKVEYICNMQNKIVKGEDSQVKQRLSKTVQSVTSNRGHWRKLIEKLIVQSQVKYLQSNACKAILCE